MKLTEQTLQMMADRIWVPSIPAYIEADEPNYFLLMDHHVLETRYLMDTIQQLALVIQKNKPIE